MKKQLFITGILLPLLIGFGSIAHAQHSHSKPFYSSMTDSLQTVITYKDDKVYQFRMEDDKIIGLSIDKHKIPEDSFYLYEPIAKKILVQIKIDRVQAKEDKVQAEEDQVQAEKDKIQAEKDQMEASKDDRQAKLDAEEESKDAHQAKLDAEQARKDARQAKLDAEQASGDQAQAKRDMEQAKLDMAMAEKDKAAFKSLIAELVKEKLIPDEKSLTQLMLNEYVFVINGQRQPEELLNKFKAMYITRTGYSISFHNDSK
jgi:colicin import membrane protein